MLKRTRTRRRTTTELVVHGAVWAAMVLGGCGLRLNLLGDAGVPDDAAVLDAAQYEGGPFPDAEIFHCFAYDGAAYSSSVSCADSLSSVCSGMIVGNRCQVPGRSECLTSGPCPSTWAAAQLPSSCKGGDGVILGTCGQTNAWYRPAFYLTCTYDMSDGTLIGMRQRGPDPAWYCPGGATPQDEEVIGFVPDPCVVASTPISYSCP